MTKVRCLSVHQPHANLIVRNEKPFEIRGHNTGVRGYLLIVSTVKRLPNHPGPYGTALCFVTLVGSRPMVAADAEAAHVSYAPNRWAWILEDVRPVRPFHIVGAQGYYFRDVPGDVARLLEHPATLY